MYITSNFKIVMNITRKLCHSQYQNKSRIIYRKFQLSCFNNNSSSTAQPKAYEKFEFEDIKTIERQERRHEKIPPFMKDVFGSIFNRELLAFPEILNKEEATILDNRIINLEKIFQDPKKSINERRNMLKEIGMYGAPAPLTKGGFAMNNTESLRYLDVIGSDLHLGLEISYHWVSLNILRQGLNQENYNKLIDDLLTGDSTIALCIKEREPERMTQADFKTTASLNSKGVWVINGEKICLRVSQYLLVLCLVEANRYQAFLVHPNATGIEFDKNLVTFHNTPATQLNEITELDLAKALGVLRLHTSTFCRNILVNAVRFCSEYVRPRFISGKPLSGLLSIQGVFGEALATVYASESAEYFTAGLLDKYVDPDAEIEMAMCRNFTTKHSQDVLLKLLAIPGFEKHEECNKLLEEMRMLTSHGENVYHVNSFIALTGIHSAAKIIAEEVNNVNPVFNAMFFINKIFANKSQENDRPKLTIYLAEHLHPSLKMAAENLEYCVLRMRYACETLLARHGTEIAAAHLELYRLAEAGTEILAMTAALARASRSYCIGVRNSEIEIKLASYVVSQSRPRLQKLIRDIEQGEYVNNDYVRVSFGKNFFKSKGPLTEKPTVLDY